MSKVTFDGNNRVIQVTSGVTDINFEIDVYQEWKQWVLNGNMSYHPFVRKIGGEKLIEGELYLPTAYIIYNGWKIRPQESDHILKIRSNVFTVDNSPIYTLPTGYQIVVDVETIEGGLNPYEHNMVKDLWRVMGLDKSSPMTVTKDKRTTTNIDQDFEEGSNGSVTVKRN